MRSLFREITLVLQPSLDSAMIRINCSQIQIQKMSKKFEKIASEAKRLNLGNTAFSWDVLRYCCRQPQQSTAWI